MGENEHTAEAQADRSSAIQGVKELIERVFLAGMGAAAITKDRLQELVEEVVKKGQISAEEGREVVDRLLARSREEARSALDKADASLQTAYRGLGISSKEEFEGLKSRMDGLEHRVRLLEQQADGGKAGS